jgi:hypothetical protein
MAEFHSEVATHFWGQVCKLNMSSQSLFVCSWWQILTEEKTILMASESIGVFFFLEILNFKIPLVPILKMFIITKS